MPKNTLKIKKSMDTAVENDPKFNHSNNGIKYFEGYPTANKVVT